MKNSKVKSIENNSSRGTDRNRIIYLDILRVLSIFAVIILHVASDYWHDTDVSSFDWQIINFYDSISRWSVPVFVMISGALFLSRDIPVKTLYTKYIRKIVLLFIVWSFGYALLFKIIVKHSIKGFVVSFIKGHYHMWFLYMIVGLYMIIPFLKRIVQKEALLKYYLILSFFFALVIPQLVSIISTFSEKYGLAAQKVVNNINLYFVLGFPIYFILGYYISKTSVPGRIQKSILLLGIVGFLSTILFTAAISIYKKEAVDIFYSYLSVNVFLEAILIFTLIKTKLSGISFSPKASAIIKTASNYTLGVYLIHPFYIKVLSKAMSFSNISFSYVFSIPVLSILVFILSIITTGLLNRIPYLRNLV